MDFSHWLLLSWTVLILYAFGEIWLKSNFLGTKHEAAIACEAAVVHGGRATQVWDATVSDEESGKKLALFRCTQMILYGG